MLLFIILACNPNFPILTPQPGWPDQDFDGDGWTEEEGDCNDDNIAIFPGAPEKCDREDNDCDNDSDEEPKIGRAHV